MSLMGPGFLVFFEKPNLPPAPQDPPIIVGGGSVDSGRYGKTWYKGDESPWERKQRIERIKREDQEILEFIIAFVTKGPTE